MDVVVVVVLLIINYLFVNGSVIYIMSDPVLFLLSTILMMP